MDYVTPAEEAMTDPTSHCTTCGKPSSFQASICSNSFHCCRDCTWAAGRRIQLCAYHAVAECAECACIAAEDGDILPPACPAHGGVVRVCK